MLKTLLRASTPRGWTTSRNFTASTTLHRPVDMETVNTTARLQRLRELMKDNKVDIYSTSTPYTLRPVR